MREGAKAVAAGMNPMDLKRGIDKAVSAVVEELKKRTKKITTPAETAQVGAIAANGRLQRWPMGRQRCGQAADTAEGQGSWP